MGEPMKKYVVTITKIDEFGYPYDMEAPGYLAADVAQRDEELKEILAILVSGEQYGTRYWKAYMADDRWWAVTKAPQYSSWLATRLLARLEGSR